MRPRLSKAEERVGGRKARPGEGVYYRISWLC